MKLKATILKVEPMQTHFYGPQKDQEMRTQAFLLLSGEDQLWAERRSALLTPYSGTEFDSRLQYEFWLRPRSSQFTNPSGRTFYRTEFEILGIDVADKQI